MDAIKKLTNLLTLTHRLGHAIIGIHDSIIEIRRRLAERYPQDILAQISGASSDMIESVVARVPEPLKTYVTIWLYGYANRIHKLQ